MSDILGRVGNILRANINEALDNAEDPEKMIDQLVRDYTDNIQEAEQAVAQTVGNLRLAEDDLKRAQEEASEWGSKAQAAAAKASEFTGAGNPTEAARFDDLAKTALRQQISYENQAKGYQEQVTAQTTLTNQLKEGLNGMRAKLTELQTKRDELAARAKMAEAQRQVQESVASIDVMDPTSDLARYEEKIRQDEAMARGMAEVKGSSLESAFDALEDATADAEVEARLAALKSGGTAPAPAAPVAPSDSTGGGTPTA
jgi:phage shock protein A